MASRTWLAALLLCLACALPARAEDEAAEARDVAHTLDFERYRLPPPPVGPRLSVPPDIISMNEDAHAHGIWNLDWATENGTWLPFDAPYLDDMALSPDSVATLLHAALAHEQSLADSLSIDESDDVEGARVLRGSPAAVAAARAALPWILDGLAPSMRADAVLTVDLGDGAPRLRAMGSVTLWPGRWTRVYLQETDVPCTPAWDLEVAQEATVMDPVPMMVREGRELYLRFHPGETRSIVEVWAGDVEHLEIVRRDLTGIRNIPEANAVAVVSFPRSAVNRVFTQVVVPAGAGARREIHWRNAGRNLSLGLELSRAPRPAPVFERGTRNALALVRSGAVASALEFDARPKRVSAWNERMQGVMYDAAGGYERKGGTFEFSISAVDGGSVFFLDAPQPELAKARAVLARAEAKLVGVHVHVRSLTVPEPAYRKALLDGALRMGEAVPGAVLAAFREAGATDGEALSATALLDTPLGFRAGRSEPGLVDFDAEIAQASAGLAPSSSARFAGLFGELRVRGTETGLAVRLRGAACWADGAAGSIEMTFRPPVSMRGGTEGAAAGKDAARRESLPILGGGHAPIDREVETGAEGAADLLMHAHVRGDEVVVVLVSARR